MVGERRGFVCSVTIIKKNVVNTTYTCALDGCGLGVTILRGGGSIYYNAAGTGDTVVRTNCSPRPNAGVTHLGIHNSRVTRNVYGGLSIPCRQVNSLIITFSRRRTGAIRRLCRENYTGKIGNLRV